MKQLKQYMYLEIKRMFLSLPKIFLGSLFLFALLAGFLAVCAQGVGHEKEKNRITVAVTAAVDEPFVDWMITTVSNMKNTAYICSFERMEEDLAEQKLKSGEIDAVFLIPRQYIASIIKGENKPVTIRFGKSQATVADFLFRQLCEAASSYILGSEAGIYSLQEYYAYHNLPKEREDELELNLRYIKEIIDLNQAVSKEETLGKGSYPLTSQYAVSGLLLFLLFQGLAYSKLLAPGSRSLQNQLTLEHLGYGRQLLAKETAFFLSVLPTYLFFFLIISIVVKISGFTLPETIFSDFNGIWRFAVSCIPLFITSTILILLVYEITEDAAGGLLLLTFSILLMGLCSGFFYPLEHLPQAVRSIAPLLPTYHLLQYGLAVLHQSFAADSFLMLIFFSALSCLLIIIRKEVSHA